ncbi:MAG: type II toxin-antitoxin system MqsA family antitoxin [Candidatus Methanoperedens sp.]|nr:type II toxin-antitoxin system MqsA family antitoxin [Candidatus Methanoperedens sp.]
MKPDRCSFCKGKLIKGNTEFVVKVGAEVLSIRDVPAYICNECGEPYYTPEVSEKMDLMMKKFHECALLVHPVAAGELSLNEVTA